MCLIWGPTSATGSGNTNLEIDGLCVFLCAAFGLKLKEAPVPIRIVFQPIESVAFDSRKARFLAIDEYVHVELSLSFLVEFQSLVFTEGIDAPVCG